MPLQPVIASVLSRSFLLEYVAPPGHPHKSQFSRLIETKWQSAAVFDRSLTQLYCRGRSFLKVGTALNRVGRKVGAGKGI
ncbi:MAG TPA: hypothetical protein VJ746_13375 [Nitrospira sp.]|nr:hypothetical protein [Nitrospira sp.]